MKEEKPDDHVKKSRTLIEKWIVPLFQRSTYSPRVLIIGGSSIAALSVTRLMYSIANSFLALTPATSMYYGFLGGIIASGTAASVIYIGERSFRVDPYRAVVASMAVIHKNKDLHSLLGSRVSAGKVYSYTATGGGFGARTSGSESRWPIVWKSPQVQMLYVLQCSQANAVVSVVYSKHGLFSEVVDFVGIDCLSSTGEPIQLTLAGDKSSFVLKSLFKSHAAQVLRK